MGCCQTHKLPVTPEDARRVIAGIRKKHGENVLLMSIKDQNTPGKVYMCGPASPDLIKAFDEMLKREPKNEKVEQKCDKYDGMYDYCWHNTQITSGHQMFSLAKSYFPRGKTFVKMLDTIAEHGWSLVAAPNFGGVESRDDKGNVTSTVDWPVFIFYKDPPNQEQIYSKQHLLFAIKDSNVPGKVCVAGPVGDLEQAMVPKLKAAMGKSDVKSEKDSYDEDYDVVWRDTSITTGHSTLSFQKSYFPKTRTCVAMLQGAYEAGWRLVACPNFGGQGDSWPCFVFRQLKSNAPVPSLIIAAIKDSNIPGKLCLSGTDLPSIQDSLLQAMKVVKDNEGVEYKSDSYDGDHQLVMHNVKITTGMAAFSLKLPYFPRCDSVMAFLTAMQTNGYSCVGCPNFGGMLDSWPTFVFEQHPNPPQCMYLAVKDDNIPGKLNLGGGGVEQDATIQNDVLQALKDLCGDQVTLAQDDYDRTFGLCYKNVKITTGTTMLTFTKPYFPHGYVVEAVLAILRGQGWAASGGPNFGDSGNTWPSIVFHKVP